MSETRRPASGAIDLSQPCPLPACAIGYVVTDEGAIDRCPLCHGAGRVSLGTWQRFTFEQAKK